MVTQTGRIFTFGSNEFGQLGLGHNDNVLKPSCVKVLKPDKVLAVACGKTHTVVGMISGRVFESDRFVCRTKLYSTAVIR